MRRLALLACVLGCAEWRMPPTFPERAAGQPVIHEQAILGLSEDGDAAAVELLDAEGEPPRLLLLAFGRGGEPTRTLLQAPPERAKAIADQLRISGHEPTPLLGALVATNWGEAASRAEQLGYASQPPSQPVAGEWRVPGASAAGELPFAVLISRTENPAPAVALLLSDGAGDPIELTRMPLAGAAVQPRLWITNGPLWLLAGSVLPGKPLHRAVGLRRGSLRRAEAQLHNLHGLDDYRAGDIDAAIREFNRAIAADPRFVDGLYNAASAAALASRAEEAVALLRRAVALDPARVQVLGRNDEDFQSLRKRPDVRALLGLRRLPPEGVPPPP
jgi:tetratricopeptide (TPR) repeat protein